MSGREKPCLVLPQNNLGSSCPFALSHLKFNIDLSSSMKKPLLDLVIACRRVNILTMSRLLISEHSVYEQGTCTLLHCFSHVQLFATPWTPGSSVPGILQAKILAWITMPSSRGSSQPRDRTKSPGSPALTGGFFTISAASVQFSRSVVSDSLRLHGLQPTRLPCPSPTPRAYSNSCLLRQ